jgi:hypothetical protein
MEQDQFDTVLTLVNDKIARPGRAVWRYLHRDRPVPRSLDGSLMLDRELGSELELADRFPFYGIRPAIFPLGGDVQVADGQLSARSLSASFGPELQEINRACPIVSGLTFWFDRGEDFFRWPELVYDRFFYVGVFADGDLVGYCMAGLTRAWTGGNLGWLAVLGDARVLPEHRGRGWIDVALEKLAAVAPRSVALGLFIINEGNQAADHLRSRFRLAGYDVRPAGRLTVWNLLLMRRRRPVPGVAVTTATPADLDSLTRFLAA